MLSLVRPPGPVVCYLDSCNQENTMPTHREQRRGYLIEASAFHMPGGNKWQPRLTMTRLPCAESLSKSQSFPGLTPLFGTARGAAQYAADLGRTMADEDSPRLTI